MYAQTNVDSMKYKDILTSLTAESFIEQVLTIIIVYEKPQHNISDTRNKIKYEMPLLPCRGGYVEMDR